MRLIPRVKDIPLPDMPGELPSLSVVIAARNEQRRIGDCLESLAASEYPRIEVIVVNDRSDDKTGEIADSYAARFPRLFRVIHVSEVPSGWLGKCHALSTGAGQASGDFILFTDADVIFDPMALAHVLAHADRERADQVVVFPDTITYTFLEKVTTTAFAAIFVTRFNPLHAMRRRSAGYIGAGAFNLVRRRVYERIGGHRFLRLHVIDDLALGKLVKYAGGVVRLLVSGGMVRVRWQESFRQTISGFDKNAFAAMNYNPVRAVVAATLLFLVFWYGVIGLFLGPPGARILSALLLVVQPAMLYRAFRSVQHVHWIYAVTLPLGAAFISWAIIRSTAITLWQGGVRWRGSFYPLTDLRRYRL